MQIGRFFSLRQGRVGQFLSPRVLVVRMPFRSPLQGGWSEQCYFGFSTLTQAQKFSQLLTRMGLNFQLKKNQAIPDCNYSIVLTGQATLARTLAQWHRQNTSILESTPVPIVQNPPRSAVYESPSSNPAIAA